MKDNNPSLNKGNCIVGLGFLLTSFSFTVFMKGDSQIIAAAIGIALAVCGFYLLKKEKSFISDAELAYVRSECVLFGLFILRMNTTSCSFVTKF